jgi:cyclase
MNRRKFLGASVATAALYSLPLSLLSDLGFAETSTPDPLQKFNDTWAKAELVVTPVAENLHMLSGIGGNIAVLSNGPDALLIDAGSHLRTNDVLDKVRDFGSKRVTTLVDTHWHFDHCDGNENLAHAGAKIIAHENTKKRLSTPQVFELLNLRFQPSPKAALPRITFSDTHDVQHQGENLHLTHFADAHTDSDVLVVFEKANVIHSGDLVFNGFYPVIDYSTKGWIGGQAAGAQKIADLAKDDTKIIPGHGPLADRKAVQAFADMLKSIHEQLVPAMEQGMTVAEVVSMKPTRNFDEKWGKGMFTGDQFAEIAYKGLLRHQGKQIS